MQGQTERLSDSSIVAHAFEYKWLKDALVPLQNPVGENITYDKKEGCAVTRETDAHTYLKEHVLGAACYGHTNMVPKFCESYIEQTKTDVVAVHAAKGSTVVGQWLPGTPGYDMVVEKSLGAIRKAQETGELGLIYFVWLQGESDACQKCPKEVYKEQLRKLGAGLKKDLGIEKFGVIRVGRFSNDEGDLEIMAAQDEVCEEEEDFVMLTRITTQLNEIQEYMSPEFAGHYSAKGLEKLGEVAGKALGEQACLDRFRKN